MSSGNEHLLTSRQLETLTAAFHRGAAHASEALAKWIGKPSVVEVDSVEQLPIEQATGILTNSEEPMCFCVTEMQGVLGGEMILAFDDASGMLLSDMLLDQAAGTTVEWSEMATSVALETTNILCCAYLNSLSQSLAASGGAQGLLPSPPEFRRDFAESLLQFALMGQAIASDHVVLATTRFEIDATPVNWTLVLVPDADSMVRLPGLLSASRAGG